MTEKQKMINCEFYKPWDPELCKDRYNARKLTHKYNRLKPSKTKKMGKILRKLLTTRESEGYLCIEPPFQCDYGYNISVGKNFFANYNTVILDSAPITIGDDVMFGPNVSVYSVNHPLNADKRCEGPEIGSKIDIGNKCWIGGNVTILPGVTIGAGTTIGAGSVVTKDIPPGVFAAGVPCKVIKEGI